MLLGVIMQTEQQLEGMIEIMASLSTYLPHPTGSKSPSTIQFCGDQLTCERLRSAQQACVQADTHEERLQGLVEMPTDWHALVTFYQVSFNMHYHALPCITMHGVNMSV